MKVPIEVEIPDGAVLGDWVVTYCYLPADGEEKMQYAHRDGMNSPARYGLTGQAFDRERAHALAEWDA